ncbi:MAG: hypothetical protein U0271_15225 [Polyangiaceae bacterium]
MSGTAPPDPAGLSAALALAPSTFSRNRYPALFERAEVRAAVRRARLVRHLVRQLLGPEPCVTLSTLANGDTQVDLEIASLGFRRCSVLTPLERDLMVHLFDRAVRALADADPQGLSPAKLELRDRLCELSGGAAAALARIEVALSLLGASPGDVAAEARELG